MDALDVQPSRREFLAAVGTPLLAVGSSGFASTGTGRARLMQGLVPADDLLLDRAITHLQTGTLGLTPRPVFEATVAASRVIERDPLIAAYGPGKERLDAVRQHAAALLGGTTAEIVLTASTTAGMNMVAQGLKLAPGDRIVTSDQEHHGGSLCWQWLARRQGVAIDVVPVPAGESDPDAILDRFRRAITPKTRVISFSHILYSTGLRMPASRLCALGRAHGCITVVDGAQAAGAIPVDVKAIGCHVYVASGHKWLLGPKGTGLLYLSGELGDAIDAMPLQSGRQANSDAAGISNIAGLFGLAAAIGYVSHVGIALIEAHNLALCADLRRRLAALPSIVFAGPASGPLVSQMLTFSLPKVDVKALRIVLADRYKVHVRAVEQSGYTGLRASPHLYNSEHDGQALVDALKRELA